MKKNLLVSLAVAGSFLAGMAVSTGAQSNLQDISAKLNYGITIKLNNQVFTPKDAKGATVAPIIYNGSTYLPLRTVAEAVGLSVDWDNATSTVYLGEKSEWTMLTSSMYKSSYSASAKFALTYTQDADMLAVSGTTFSNGIVAPELLNQDHKGTFTLNGKFQTMSFTVVSTEKDVIYNIMDASGKEVIKQITATPTPTAYEVDIKGLDTIVLKYGSVENSDPTKVVFGDIKFK